MSDNPYKAPRQYAVLPLRVSRRTTSAVTFLLTLASIGIVLLLIEDETQAALSLGLVMLANSLGDWIWSFFLPENDAGNIYSASVHCGT